MSRQRQDNVNLHMCHMRMSLKAQTHFNTICNVWVISPHWLTHPHLICPKASHAYTPAPDTAYHPYARGVPSQHAPDTADPYTCVVPSPHAPDITYHPYACEVPSRHAPSTAYHPYAHGVPSHMLPTLLTILTLAECNPNMLPTLLTILTLAECTPNMLPTLLTILTLAECTPDTAYHPYACVVSSRHAPDTTYPYACVVPSQHCLPSLHSRGALPTCSQHHLSLRFCITSIVCSGLLAYMMNAIAKICGVAFSAHKT
ncbi:hypothetical protein O181_061400 [Austropuccinia psidii MF-1]|uniref:Uncharacterized protein n=1 Tax=Austropuccinia psidii MF-1 TaxID=1389203 RepID=A0A9Q3EF41_9BASI|nr:hypothetical protein [Austropuccinia psidii MF-1]